MTLYITPYGRLAHRRMIEQMLHDRDWEVSSERDIVLPVDVKAEADAYTISALIPGIKAEDLNIEIVNETVSISGRLENGHDDKAEYLIEERPHGNFNRVIELPVALDSNAAEAKIENGVLTLHIPKAEAARPRTIKVVSK
jgi:HSP20 family protein